MRTIRTDKAPIPGGCYSQARVSGKLLFTAGITGVIPETGELISFDIGEQTSQTLKNLSEIIKAAGSNLEHVIKSTCYIDNIEDFSRFNEAYKAFFSLDPPARTTVEIARFTGETHVEIEMIAEIPD